jgi:hypothetical protein
MPDYGGTAVAPRRPCPVEGSQNEQREPADHDRAVERCVLSAPARKFVGGDVLACSSRVGRATPRPPGGVRGGPVPARGPVGAGRDGGLRLGSRRDRPAPGRCRPARRCVIPALWVAGMGSPPLAAMLAAATRSRYPQCGQRNTRPAGLGTRREQDGHVEDVPRSSVTLTVIPVASALLPAAASPGCLLRIPAAPVLVTPERAPSSGRPDSSESHKPARGDSRPSGWSVPVGIPADHELSSPAAVPLPGVGGDHGELGYRRRRRPQHQDH